MRTEPARGTGGSLGRRLRRGAALALLAGACAASGARGARPCACDWDSLSLRLEAARGQAREARIASDPAALRASEEAYAVEIARASERLTRCDSTALPVGSAPAIRGLIRQLLSARDPEALAWLRRQGPGIARRIDAQGELRFWLGVEAFGREDWRAAASYLADPVPPGLSGYAEWMRVRSAEEFDGARAGREAEAILARSPSHPFRGLLTIRAARAMTHDGRLADARALLESYLSMQPPEDWLRAAAHTWLAEIHDREGRRDEFIVDFVRSAGLAPGDAEAGGLRLSQGRRILADAQHGDKPLSFSALEACLRVLLELAEPREAYEAWVRGAGGLGVAARSRTAVALIERLHRAREDSLAVGLAQRLAAGVSEIEAGAWAVDRAARARAQLFAGRVYRRGGNRALMTSAFRAASQPGTDAVSLSTEERATAALALWELGRELEDGEVWAEAAAAYAELRARFPADEQAAAAGLRLAFCHERGGRRTEALVLLEELCRSAPHNLTGEPCLWRALLGDPQEREAFLRRGGRETHPGYYARRASAALGLAGEGAAADSLYWTRLAARARDPRAWPWSAARPLAPEMDPAALAGLLAGEPSVETGELFLALGHARWARRAWSGIPGWRSLEPREQAALLRAVGDIEESIRVGIRCKDALARYPLAYTDEVAEAADRFGLSPALIYAVIRQESLFAGHALSRAGAQGLMQLMPATARRMADSLGWDDYDVGRPRDNILLGSCHLAELLRATGGRLPVALAGYNAGLDRARRWWRTARGTDEFIERIGFTETRGFVRSVLSHLAHYETLYGVPASAGRSAAAPGGAARGD